MINHPKHALTDNMAGGAARIAFAQRVCLRPHAGALNLKTAHTKILTEIAQVSESPTIQPLRLESASPHWSGPM